MIIKLIKNLFRYFFVLFIVCAFPFVLLCTWAQKNETTLKEAFNCTYDEFLKIVVDMVGIKEKDDSEN